MAHALLLLTTHGHDVRLRGRDLSMPPEVAVAEGVTERLRMLVHSAGRAVMGAVKSFGAKGGRAPAPGP